MIEMAMVLVIIGLLIGGILKGRSVIQNAKTKNLVNSADELRAAVMTFYDKYGMYPGDEDLANAPPGDSNDGGGNGQMNGYERAYVFEDLAKAGMISGSYDNGNKVANHAFGDRYFVYYTTVYNNSDHWIRYDNLPWDVCQEIERKHDDGNYQRGSIRASEDYTENNTPIGRFYIRF